MNRFRGALALGVGLGLAGVYLAPYPDVGVKIAVTRLGKILTRTTSTGSASSRPPTSETTRRAIPLTIGLALGALAVPGHAGAGHSAITFDDTLMGLAAFALGFALAWLAPALHKRVRPSRQSRQR